MPRYFFDIERGILCRDEDGLVFDDADEARSQGIAAAGAMVAEESRTFVGGDVWTMTICDELGLDLLHPQVFRARPRLTLRLALPWSRW